MKADHRHSNRRKETQINALTRSFACVTPKWCSSLCRHRAWELTRAAASGHAAVQVVDRVVEVDRLVTVVQEVPVHSPQGRGMASGAGPVRHGPG